MQPPLRPRRRAVDQGVDRVWVDNPLFLAKVWGKTGSKIYGAKAGADYEDNQVRFRIFSGAAIEACRKLPFGYGEDVVFVANDWHSAMVPALLKNVYKVTWHANWHARTHACM